MELKFSNRFRKDRDNYSTDEEFLKRLAGKMKELQNAKSVDEVGGLENIRGRKIHYRFKVKLSKITYRVGIKLLAHKIWFACIDDNKKRFYKRF